MRVSIIRATGRLLESQSDSADPLDFQSMYINAQAAGYLPDEISIRVVTDEEYATILAAQPLSDDVVRIQEIQNDVDTQDLINSLALATPTQIKDYVTNNITDLASARVLLMKMLLVLATLASR